MITQCVDHVQKYAEWLRSVADPLDFAANFPHGCNMVPAPEVAPVAYLGMPARVPHRERCWSECLPPQSSRGPQREHHET
jgi:hypothetical protein